MFNPENPNAEMNNEAKHTLKSGTQPTIRGDIIPTNPDKSFDYQSEIDKILNKKENQVEDFELKATPHINVPEGATYDSIQEAYKEKVEQYDIKMKDINTAVRVMLDANTDVDTAAKTFVDILDNITVSLTKGILKDVEHIINTTLKSVDRNVENKINKLNEEASSTNYLFSTHPELQANAVTKATALDYFAKYKAAGTPPDKAAHMTAITMQQLFSASPAKARNETPNQPSFEELKAMLGGL